MPAKAGTQWARLRVKLMMARFARCFRAPLRGALGPRLRGDDSYVVEILDSARVNRLTVLACR
jgi:hypothetical protein